MGFKLFACGDYVNCTNNEHFISENLKKSICDCDYSICNFEAPIETDGMKPIKKAGPRIFQSRESIKYLKNSGFNIVSLANNHIYDYGQSALTNTIEEFIKNEIIFIGGGRDFEESYKTLIIEKDNIKIGLISGCENEFGCLYEKQHRGGYSWLLHEKIEDNIRLLKTKVDFVVLIAHAGIENIDFPIKEWRDKYKRFCAAGADIVVGHHPHVPQGYEIVNGKIIFYSLGNFYFDNEIFKNSSDDSFSVVLKFEKNKNIDFNIIYHKKFKGQTCMVEESEVGFNIQKLNSYLQKDYEKNNIEISLKLFKEYYLNYYETALGALPEKSTFFQKVKFFIKSIIRKKEEKNLLLLLHNVRIDSHRFLVQRALSSICE